MRGVVGVTYTTSFCGGGQGIDVPTRTNYNLRGHRSEVKILFTADQSGQRQLVGPFYFMESSRLQGLTFLLPSCLKILVLACMFNKLSFLNVQFETTDVV